MKQKQISESILRKKKRKTQIPKLVACSKYYFKRKAYSERCLQEKQNKTKQKQRSQVNNFIPRGIRQGKTNSPQKKERKNKDWSRNK